MGNPAEIGSDQAQAGLTPEPSERVSSTKSSSRKAQTSVETSRAVTDSIASSTRSGIGLEQSQSASQEPAGNLTLRSSSRKGQKTEARSDTIALSDRRGSSSEQTQVGMTQELSGNVTLKVGSRKFQTTADTLKAFPESFFGLMASGISPPRFEKDGSVLIERNPKHFPFVLEYLRNAGEGFTPPATTAAQDELRAEADFYGLPGLVTLLGRVHVASQHLMTVGRNGSTLTGNNKSAAMLEVRDPSNFSVTFTLSQLRGDYPIFIGIGPKGTDLKATWRKSSMEINYPPVVKNGLFFGFSGFHCKRGSMITADFDLKETKTIGNDYYETVESIRVVFNRDSAVTRVSFHVVTSSRETLVWPSTLAEVGLPQKADYRPMLFLNSTGTVLINEISS